MKWLIQNITRLDSLIFVRDELDKVGLQIVSVDVNEIKADAELAPYQHEKLMRILDQAGIEVLEGKKNMLIKRIKHLITEIVYHSQEPLVHNLSTHLAEMLGYDYTYMSNLFSTTEHRTIEQYYICHKIERVKELLVYEKLTLTDIAYKMHYSSTAHLCNQFKKVSGYTPSQFKQLYKDQDFPPNAL